MFATNAIIYSSNLLTTFIFYEILTISTYPLVTFKGDSDSISNGKKYLYYLLGTSIIFLLPAIIIIYSIAGTLDYEIGGILTSYNNPLVIKILIILLIFGVAKSAIMPFHKWLPFAMIAPTPVSALLHAVAVVKSGVFIIIKVVLYIFGPLILQESGADIIIILFASITILLSSIIAIKQDSIKLRLAYSTIGQLSYIVLAIAILAPYSILAATLHLIFHAIGKIILFLTAGIITTGIGIKKVSEMNGLASKFPYTIFLMSLGALIMIGLPPTIGFISKWYLIVGIIESTKIYLLAVIIISTLLNASYYLPMIYKPYFKSFETKYNEGNSEDMRLVAPVIIIGLAAIILFFNTDSIIIFIQEYIIKL
jgi:multicomponent Na+:H+ antiporter subunit D